MKQKHTFDEIQAASRPVNPRNGSTYVDLSGQMWEFRYGRFVKTSTTAELRRVKLF